MNATFSPVISAPFAFDRLLSTTLPSHYSDGEKRESMSDAQSLAIRPAIADDEAALWRILEPVIRAGETYPLPRDMSKAEALAYWHAPAHAVFVAERGSGQDREIVGTYYLRANHAGGGAHVANCGYMTASWATGRGVATALCNHSLAEAKARGFRAMQFNLVVSSNERAVRLWQHCGFTIVGRLPEVFAHPRLGYVDAYVMIRTLV
jgi:RimJ/RimL family protein N-acetyltransferase